MRADPLPRIEGTVSGCYEQVDAPRNTLRLDVDGDHPQMAASGVLASGISDRVHWIARLQPETAADGWSGEIFFKDGTLALLPHTQIHVSISQLAGFRQAQVEFRGAGSPVVRSYRRRSPSFYPMEFEFDVVDAARLRAAAECGPDLPERPSAGRAPPARP
jgi:hypothetical protein